MMGLEEVVGSVNAYERIRCCHKLYCGQCEFIILDEYAAVRSLRFLVRVEVSLLNNITIS